MPPRASCLSKDKVKKVDLLKIHQYTYTAGRMYTITSTANARIDNSASIRISTFLVGNNGELYFI